MAYQAISKEESKSSDQVNLRDCEKNMEDEETVKEKSKSSADDGEKNMEGQIDDVVGLAVASTVLCLVLSIFPILKISSDGRKFMEEYHDVMMVMLMPFVGIIQFLFGGVSVVNLPDSGRIYDILFMLVLSSTISVAEVSVFSLPAAVLMIIFWIIVTVIAVTAHWDVISSGKIVFSNGIQKFVAIICVLSIVYTVKSLVDKVY